MQIFSPITNATPITGANASSPVTRPHPQTDPALALEKMLWSEMLTHVGFEKAMTMNGGEDVAAFSRFVIDELAGNLAETQPFGVADDFKAYFALETVAQTGGLSG